MWKVEVGGNGHHHCLAHVFVEMKCSTPQRHKSHPQGSTDLECLKMTPARPPRRLLQVWACRPPLSSGGRGLQTQARRPSSPVARRPRRSPASPGAPPHPAGRSPSRRLRWPLSPPRSTSDVGSKTRMAESAGPEPAQLHDSASFAQVSRGPVSVAQLDQSALNYSGGLEEKSGRSPRPAPASPPLPLFFASPALHLLSCQAQGSKRLYFWISCSPG